eukprot:TRINITY_DN58335_c0_g1_i1.p1 TRINITY_DN58335_c0_g1~~TRINITY_DN58335_c0_g1_i1.p1  ORF type:complete len:326 (-),score=61.29 TRINITY_DN58335_c0_g1_i1:235-1212(-)
MEDDFDMMGDDWDDDVQHNDEEEPQQATVEANPGEVEQQEGDSALDADTLAKLLEDPAEVKPAPIDDVPFVVQNIITSFHLGVDLDLRQIIIRTRNSEYNPGKFGALVMRIRDPHITALMYTSGKVVVTGAKSLEAAKRGAKKITKIIATVGWKKARVHKYKVDTMVVTTDLRCPIRLNQFINLPGIDASYEPEVFSGAVYRMVDPIASALVFCSGKVTVTGLRSMEHAQLACNRVHYTCIPVRNEIPPHLDILKSKIDIPKERPAIDVDEESSIGDEAEIIKEEERSCHSADSEPEEKMVEGRKRKREQQQDSTQAATTAVAIR